MTEEFKPLSEEIMDFPEELYDVIPVEKVKEAVRLLKEESKHIKICDKIIVNKKKISLSEDLCSVKDVKKFLGKIDKIFGKELTNDWRIYNFKWEKKRIIWVT